MNIKTLLLLSLITCFSCSQKLSTVSESQLDNTSVDIIQIENTIDTILENNNPLSLDLSQHQLFIDTTKNSTFYQKIINWNTTERFSISLDTTLEAIENNTPSYEQHLKSFPNHFISLRKLKNQFVIYDRCDGNDQRFEIHKNAILFCGPLESYALPIQNIVALNPESIQLELKGLSLENTAETINLTIEKIKDYIYQFHYTSLSQNYKQYVTTIDGITHFDLVVNHCPQYKVLEFDGFDTE
ncbi:hypothetical protein ACFS5J_12080 [Flavobacterium chuncheonense]|uniref:Lipoprotein n=1 Tax=Flavobacterium chuncheonense TaxID=2026653 RepID=A0ABW5YQU7_9FLAO